MIRLIGSLKKLVREVIRDINYTSLFFHDYESEEDVMFSKLRTQSHILDKGLNIKPFEAGHGIRVYNKCNELINQIKDERLINDPAYTWAKHVISQYEDAQNTGCSNVKKVNEPVIFDKNDKAFIYSFIRSRISTRDFLEDKINSEVWDEIVEMAGLAPSSCCRQPSRYYIESDSDVISSLIENVKGATGFNRSIPNLICLTADIRAYAYIDRMLPYIDASLSMENFLLACSANNISTTVLNWQHATSLEIENVKRILNIPKYERIIAFIAAGKAKTIPIQPKRISVGLMRKR